MIKVSKEGRNTLTCECPECGCMFHFLPSDITGCCTEGPELVKHDYIRCPECREEIYKTIFKSLISDEWQMYKERREKRRNVN